MGVDSFPYTEYFSKVEFQEDGRCLAIRSCIDELLFNEWFKIFIIYLLAFKV